MTVDGKLKQKNVLVTGGAGFIGCALASRLAEACNRYVVVDNLLSQVHPSGQRPAELNQAAELLVCDVADSNSWDDLIGQLRPQIIVHLAAETGTGQSLTQASKHARTNVLGLTQALDACARLSHVPEQIVLTSSRAVYGEGAWRNKKGELFYPGQRSNAQLAAGRWDFDGTAVPSQAGVTWEHPTSIYGATKLAQEHILKSWGLSYGVPLTIFRFQNVYGPGQSPFNPYTGIVILFSQLAARKKEIELYEDGLMTRDFVFIDDVVEAIVQSIVSPAVSGCRTLDVGSGEVNTLARLAEVIAAYHQAPPPVICGKYRNGDVRHAGCDISAAMSELSWRPRLRLQEGMVALQEFLANSPVKSFR